MGKREEVLRELNRVDSALRVLEERRSNTVRDLESMTRRRGALAAELEALDERDDPQPFYARL